MPKDLKKIKKVVAKPVAKKVVKAVKVAPKKVVAKVVTKKAVKPVAKPVAKATVKPVVKPSAKTAVKAVVKPTKKVEVVKPISLKPFGDVKYDKKAEKLMHKGKERGFVTYDEILKEFPTIEEDIDFLDYLYQKLQGANIDILESGGLLDVQTEGDEFLKKYNQGGGRDDQFDSIQMYLKEIGQFDLISASEEKDLAKRIEAGQ